MGETADPVNKETMVRPYRGLLIEMAVVTGLMALAGLAISGRFSWGVILGGGLAILNFLWLDSVIRDMFRSAFAGERPIFIAVRFVLRYVVLGLVVLVIHFTGLLPTVAVILGLASFSFAVVIDGIIRIFRHT